MLVDDIPLDDAAFDGVDGTDAAELDVALFFLAIVCNNANVSELEGHQHR